MSLFKSDEENDAPSQHDGPGDEEDPPEAEDAAEEGSKQSASEPPPRDKELEDTLKELAARMSSLQSNVETVKDARGDLEAKLENMESRIHRLGGLAEAVSSEYNPFLTENEAGDPDWNPDEGEICPVEAPSALPDAMGLSREESQGEGESASSPPEDEGAPHEALGQLDQAAFLELAKGSTESQANPPSRPNGDLRDRFLLLEWVGLMMNRVGRAGLLDLMEYYEGLGWIDESTKDRVLSVAVGLEAPDSVEGDGWRADLDLHERSLLAIQHLQGEPVTKAEVDALQMELKRFFDR